MHGCASLSWLCLRTFIWSFICRPKPMHDVLPAGESCRSGWNGRSVFCTSSAAFASSSCITIQSEESFNRAESESQAMLSEMIMCLASFEKIMGCFSWARIGGMHAITWSGSYMGTYSKMRIQCSRSFHKVCNKVYASRWLAWCTSGSSRRAVGWIANVPSAFQPRSLQRSLHSP